MKHLTDAGFNRETPHWPRWAPVLAAPRPTPRASASRSLAPVPCMSGSRVNTTPRSKVLWFQEHPRQWYAYTFVIIIWDLALMSMISPQIFDFCFVKNTNLKIVEMCFASLSVVLTYTTRIFAGVCALACWQRTHFHVNILISIRLDLMAVTH